jgi:hypothetical protein
MTITWRACRLAASSEEWGIIPGCAGVLASADSLEIVPTFFILHVHLTHFQILMSTPYETIRSPFFHPTFMNLCGLRPALSDPRVFPVILEAVYNLHRARISA